MRRFLVFLVSLLVSRPGDGQENQVLFYTNKPHFEPAKIEIEGYVQVPSSSGPAIISEGQGIKLSFMGSEDDSNSELPAIQQRFLGFHRLWPHVYQGGYNRYDGKDSFLHKGFRRTQTVLQTVTRTSVVAPLCLLCTCTLGVNAFDFGNCGNLVNGLPLGAQPAVCGSGPSVVPIPTLCPARIYKRDTTNLTVGNDDGELRASPVLSLVPSSSHWIGVPGYRSSNVELESSKEDAPLVEGRKIIIKEDDDHGFDVVITRRFTTVTTVRGSLTAQVQVGGLNCLPDYLQGVTRCTNVGQ